MYIFIKVSSESLVLKISKMWNYLKNKNYGSDKSLADFSE